MLLDEDRLKAIEGMEEQSRNLGELCAAVISDMKTSAAPAWDDFIVKAQKLHSHSRNFIVAFGSFLDSFQRVADIATNSDGNLGGTKDIGATLTRICLRQRSVETKLKSMISSFNDNVLSNLNQEIDDWKKNVANLDKEHRHNIKEYKKHRAELRKKATNNLKLHQKCSKQDSRQPKSRDIQRRVNEVFEELSTYYTLTGERQKQSLRSALVEERSQFCSFSNYVRPFLEIQVSMSSELCQMDELLAQLDGQTKQADVLPSDLENSLFIKLSIDNECRKQIPRQVSKRPSTAIESLTRCTGLSTSRRRSSPSLASIFSLTSGHISANYSNGDFKYESKQSLKGLKKNASNFSKNALYNLSRDSGFTSQDHFYNSSNKTTYSIYSNRPTQQLTVSGNQMVPPALLKHKYDNSHTKRPLLSARLFYPPPYADQNDWDKDNSGSSECVPKPINAPQITSDSFLSLPLPPSNFFEESKTDCKHLISVSASQHHFPTENDKSSFDGSEQDMYETTRMSPPPLPQRTTSNRSETFNRRNPLLEEIERGVRLKQVHQTLPN